MLSLMSMDNNASLYLGRPCYLGLSKTKNCHPWYWTSARYSKEVVNSMRQVLTQYIHKQKIKHIVLIGHSGGGALAILLAPYFKQTTAVVTIAGNIDTEKWIKHHSYSPLQGLNPRDILPLSADIYQYHLIGNLDTKIPKDLTINALKGQKNTQLMIISDFGHNCCWQQIWEKILQCINNKCQLENL